MRLFYPFNQYMYVIIDLSRYDVRVLREVTVFITVKITWKVGFFKCYIAWAIGDTVWERNRYDSDSTPVLFVYACGEDSKLYEWVLLSRIKIIN